MRNIFVPMVLVLFCFGVGVVFPQSNQKIELLDSVTVESFDADTTGWTVDASRYVDNQLLDSRVVEGWPSQLFGFKPTQDTLQVFGVRAGFERRGHNYVRITPPDGVLELDGLVKEIELWVWNARRQYYLTAHVQDALGVYHTLDMGNISHLGWKRVAVKVPSSVKQVEKIHPSSDRLGLIGFTVWTDPSERVDDFQLYFDEVRILTDLFQPLLDGEDFADPAIVQRIWGDA